MNVENNLQLTIEWNRAYRPNSGWIGEWNLLGVAGIGELAVRLKQNDTDKTIEKNK
jgi:hypothetical protein